LRRACILLWVCVAAARASPPADAEVVCRDLGAGRIFARAVCEFESPPDSVLALLADFDHVADYVTTVDSSRVVGSDSLGVLVRQVATSKFVLSFTVRMTLRFRFEPEHVLRFEIAAGDFPVYFGTWKCAPAGAGTRLTYAVTCKPPDFVPRALVCHVIERDLRGLMPEIAAELARRAARGGAAAAGRE
jgi:carbon monoxide dehydrogenase subunit G